MMEISEESATARPAPAAGPLMAEMIGLSSLIMFQTMARASSPIAIIFCASPSLAISSFKSPPAEKARPAPVTTTTRVSGSYLHGFPNLAELSVHARRRRVHLVRPVDGNEQDTVWLAIELQELVIRVLHGISPVAMAQSYRIAPALRASAA